jgi:histone H3/H4
MAKKKAKKSEVILVVGSKVKELVKENGCQSSGELIQAVSEKVNALVTAACKRASDNGRKTVRAYDL